MIGFSIGFALKGRRQFYVLQRLRMLANVKRSTFSAHCTMRTKRRPSKSNKRFRAFRQRLALALALTLALALLLLLRGSII